METEDGNESPKSAVYRDLLSLKNCGMNNVNNRESSGNDRNSPSQEKNSEKNFFGSVQSTMDNSLPVSGFLILYIVFINIILPYSSFHIYHFYRITIIKELFRMKFCHKWEVFKWKFYYGICNVISDMQILLNKRK